MEILSKFNERKAVYKTVITRILTRRRNLVLVGISMLVLGSLMWNDPDKGITTINMLQHLVKPIVAIWFGFFATKALMDYFDGEESAALAATHPIGAGLLHIARAIIFAVILATFGTAALAQDVKTYIPPNAYTYIDSVKTSQRQYWPDHPK